MSSAASEGVAPTAAHSAIKSAQMVACAGRIPEPADRLRFLQLIGEAAVLARCAAQMRRDAWSLYRLAAGGGK